MGWWRPSGATTWGGSSWRERHPQHRRAGDIGGYSAQRIIRATADGIFEPEVEIGQRVETGALVARVDGTPVYAAMPGMVRGMLPRACGSPRA